ncbi:MULTISPECIES: hypothetical protein [Streptomyces]|uniref:Helix-turn-helix domain-containing protein n=1 Tax=Streptomyces bacillaris TaxID=68179 RepID=A0ABW6EE79_9ACTN|nr:hypothetical protein [Streptomyces nanshensis]UDM84805.1 hypothetical protein [Streptomyces globisporus]
MNSRDTRTVRSHHLCTGAGCRRRETRAGRGRRTADDGTLLCPDCRGELLTDLRQLPTLYRACGHLLDGSRSMSGPRERTSGGGAPGLPFNTAASDARREILTLLGSWAGLVAEARQVPRPDRTVEALAAFLVRHWGWLASHSAAGDASHELSATARRAARAADPDRDRRPVVIGTCPEPGCTGRLQSLIHPHSAEAPAVRCRVDPAHHWTGEQLMTLRRRMAAAPTATHPAPLDAAPTRTAWLTASDITRLWGVPSGSVYRLASLRAWRRRSRNGRTYYHEADVVRALSERRPRPAA